MATRTLSQLRLAAIVADTLVLGASWAVLVHARVWVQGTWLASELGLAVVPGSRHLSLVALVVPLFVVVLGVRGNWHSLRRASGLDQARSLAVSVLLAGVLLGASIFALDLGWVSRSVVAGFLAAAVPALLASRAVQLTVLRRLRRERFDPHRVLVVGEEEGAVMLLRAAARRPEWGVAVIGRLALAPGEQSSEHCAVLGTLADLSALAPTVDEVYVTGKAALPELLAEVSDCCDAAGAVLSVEASFLGLRPERAELLELGGWPVLTFPAGRHSAAALGMKRALDVVGAVLLAVLTAPVMLFIAAGVRLEDGGPALFRQERVGQHGRRFTLWKFRSMGAAAEQQKAALEALNEVDGAAFKMTSDPRVTRMGWLLRRSSLDELPQLYNVLMGEMSLVGPRPPLPDEVARYERWQLRRLSVTPGLTGLWQVSGRADLPFERWVELDLEYIDNWSLWLDLRLLLRTVPAVLRGTGAR